MRISLCTICIFFLVSCGGGDENFAGVYSISEFGTDNCLDTPVILEFESTGCDDFVGFMICSLGSYNFNEDGTYTSNISISSPDDADLDIFEESGSGSWSKDGNSLRICDNQEDCIIGEIRGDYINVVIPDDDCTSYFILKRD